MKSYLKTLALGASLLSATVMMAQPGGGFPGGGFPGGGFPGGGGFGGGGFGGFGGDQSSQAKAEYSEKFSDINYAGDDGQVYHMLDIYLPKDQHHLCCTAQGWLCSGDS